MRTGEKPLIDNPEQTREKRKKKKADRKKKNTVAADAQGDILLGS